MDQSIIDYVVNHVEPEQYYTRLFPDIRFGATNNEARICSPFTQENTPSFQINKETGAFYSFCKGNEFGGRTIVHFHQLYYELKTLGDAAKDIYHKFIRPVIDDSKIKEWEKSLRGSPKVMKYLQLNRYLSIKTIKIHRIGFNGHRIVIPIFNQFGLCVNAKFYLPGAKGSAVKMFNYSDESEERSFGSPPMIYPVSVLENVKKLKQSRVVVAEGEMDVLSLISIGVNAVCTTGGCKSWPKQFNEDFRGMRVIVLYDNDDTGKQWSNLPIKQLSRCARSIKRIFVPEKYGKDATDFIHRNKRMRNVSAWNIFFKKANVEIENDPETITEVDLTNVSLDEATSAEYSHKPIRMEGIVTGKVAAPYTLPHKIRYRCEKRDDCESCPLAKIATSTLDYEIDPMDQRSLQMVDKSHAQLTKHLFSLIGMRPSPECKAQIEVLSNYNLELILMIPTVNSRTKQYVLRSGYFIGHGLKSNRSYTFQGTSIPHPKDQKATFLFDKADPLQNEVETFKMTEELKSKLKIFQNKRIRVLAKLMSIAQWQSDHITKIKERLDLHIAADLVFHSAASFMFNEEYVHRGMLDALILGDTRCGKGFVTERLINYYQLGQIASGENCTFAGLVGGCHQSNSQWFVTWGLLPLNNDRMVVIDETSALSQDDIGKLSRVRSEGVAEIVKIVRETTSSNTRLIWLSNPRSGRSIGSYSQGVEAIPELIGNAEDISRFDFAMTVATNEVDSQIINEVNKPDQSKQDKYPSELCRSLILWAWSRQPDQIKFTSAATRLIISLSIRMGKLFSSNIPLVQAENVRFKLAKISVACAARVFSCDASGEKIIVEEEHVEAAYDFLRIVYSKESMGYTKYSNMVNSSILMSDEARLSINAFFDTDFQSDEERMLIVKGLLINHRIRAINLRDYTDGGDDKASDIISRLVRLGCLSRIDKGDFYIKSPGFTKILKEIYDGLKRKNSSL